MNTLSTAGTNSLRSTAAASTPARLTEHEFKTLMGGGGGGLVSINHDNTLSGDGSTGSPLAVDRRHVYGQNDTNNVLYALGLIVGGDVTFSSNGGNLRIDCPNGLVYTRKTGQTALRRLAFFDELGTGTAFTQPALDATVNTILNARPIGFVEEISQGDQIQAAVTDVDIQGIIDLFNNTLPKQFGYQFSWGSTGGDLFFEVLCDLGAIQNFANCTITVRVRMHTSNGRWSGVNIYRGKPDLSGTKNYSWQTSFQDYYTITNYSSSISYAGWLNNNYTPDQNRTQIRQLGIWNHLLIRKLTETNFSVSDVYTTLAGELQVGMEDQNYLRWKVQLLDESASNVIRRFSDTIQPVESDLMFTGGYGLYVNHANGAQTSAALGLGQYVTNSTTGAYYGRTEGVTVDNANCSDAYLQSISFPQNKVAETTDFHFWAFNKDTANPNVWTDVTGTINIIEQLEVGSELITLNLNGDTARPFYETSSGKKELALLEDISSGGSADPIEILTNTVNVNAKSMNYGIHKSFDDSASGQTYQVIDLPYTSTSSEWTSVTTAQLNDIAVRFAVGRELVSFRTSDGKVFKGSDKTEIADGAYQDGTTDNFRICYVGGNSGSVVPERFFELDKFGNLAIGDITGTGECFSVVASSLKRDSYVSTGYVQLQGYMNMSTQRYGAGQLLGVLPLLVPRGGVRCMVYNLTLSEDLGFPTINKPYWLPMSAATSSGNLPTTWQLKAQLACVAKLVASDFNQPKSLAYWDLSTSSAVNATFGVNGTDFIVGLANNADWTVWSFDEYGSSRGVLFYKNVTSVNFPYSGIGSYTIQAVDENGVHLYATVNESASLTTLKCSAHITY